MSIVEILSHSGQAGLGQCVAFISDLIIMGFAAHLDKPT